MFTLQSVESQKVQDAFRLAVERNRSGIDNNDLVARVGEFLGCPVLKLDKSHWHNRGEAAVPGEIFFSIWLDEKDRFNYNIHALKLRHLSTHKLQSREFASAFRSQFDPTGWPNISTDFGPQTLIQGWIPLDGSLDDLIKKFIEIHQNIDELLEARK